MGEKLTKADVKKIEEEIEHRKLVLRPELIQAVKEARAQGDLSENFEYYAAKREKNRNESRIGYLERMLKFATIIEDRAAADEVGLNKMVEVYFVDEDESESYKVVTSIRSETTEGRISIESPLGKALLGHKVGDRVQVSLPQAASAQQDTRPHIVSITVTEDGKVLFDRDDEPTRELTSRVKEQLNSDPDTVFVVRGDKKADYQFVVSVFDALKEAGTRHVSIATETGGV